MRIAAVTAASCLVMAAAVLAGWLFGWPVLTTFAVGRLPAHPGTAFAFAFIAIVQLRALAGRTDGRLVLLLLASAASVPLLAAYLLPAGLRPIQWLPGGLARLIAQPSHVTALITLALLIGALVPDTGTGRRSARIALGLATIALLISGVVLTAYLDRIDVMSMGNIPFVMSVPITTMSMAMAVSIIARRHRDGWAAVFSAPHEDVIRWPLLIVILIVVQMQCRSLVDTGILAEGMADALVLVINIAAIVIIVARGSQRLGERRRERDELRDAVDLVAVMMVDRSGIIRHWSRGCEDLYGWTAAEAIGRSRVDLLRSEGGYTPDDVLLALDETGDWQGELDEYHRDGRRLAIHDHARLFDCGEQRSAVIAVTDVTERRDAEAALRLSEMRLRAAVEAQRLVIIEWDMVEQQIDWTMNLEGVVGIEPPYSIAAIMAWSDRVISREDKAALRLDVEAAIVSKETHFQRTIALRNGPDEQLFIELSGLVIYSEGEAARLIFACYDVTEYYRREEAVMVGEARLATAVAAQGIFIYEYDLIAERPIWTTRGDSFLGLAADPAGIVTPDASWQAVPEIAQQVQASLAEAIADGKDRVHFSFDFRRLDGVQRRADSWARIICDDEGRPVRVIGTHLDITERHDREMALRASEAEMRAILATVPDAMIVCDESGAILAFSQTAEALFGYRAGELIGRNILDLAVDGVNGRVALRRALSHVVNDRRAVPRPLSLTARRSGGETVPVSFVIGDALVEGQRMFVIFGRDMRPHIADEQKFHKLQNDLAQVSRLGMMGEMAAALAHELSQPLAAIVNYVGAAELMLDKEGEPVRIRHAIRGAGEQATRAGEIIRRLRAFIVRGEAEMRVEPIARLIREAAALALFNISSLGVKLTYDFESNDRAILADRIQIQQVLVNLIRNGVDAMTSSGCTRREMIISTYMDGENLLVVEVRDSGPGISADVHERLFQPFATTKTEGLGFGLAISRRIVEAHGGHLSADVGLGEGAVFRFTLPAMEQETLGS